MGQKLKLTVKKEMEFVRRAVCVRGSRRLKKRPPSELHTSSPLLKAKMSAQQPEHPTQKKTPTVRKEKKKHYSYAVTVCTI